MVSLDFHSREIVIFILAAEWSHYVPEKHLAQVEGPGIIVVERYNAYQAVDKVKSGLIVMAFCWRTCAQLSGDARSWPDQEAWAMGWVERIGELYRLNDQRLEVRDDAAAFATPTRDPRAVTAFEHAARRSWQRRTCTRRRGRSWRAWATSGPPDGLRRAPRGADGQQHGAAIGTRAGGASEELLR